MIKILGTLFKVPGAKSYIRKNLGPHTFEVIGRHFEQRHIQEQALRRGDDPYLFNAPALMFFIGPEKEDTCEIDAIIAAQNVAAFAPALGIGTCFSGLLAHAYNGYYPPIKGVLPIPKGFAVYTALIVGYQKYKTYNVAQKRDRNVHYIR